MSDSDSWITLSDWDLSFSTLSIKSLEETALDCIAKKFDVFNSIFLNSNCPLLRTNTQFLRKVYSQKLLSALSQKCLVMKDEYVKFFMNEYLKDFELYFFPLSSFNLLLSLFKDIGHSFHKMNLSKEYASELPEGFYNTVIAHSPNVVELILPSYANDETLKTISKTCKHLKRLELHQPCDITPSIIIALLNSIPCLEEIKYLGLPHVLYSYHKEEYENHSLKKTKYHLTSLDFRAISPYPSNHLIDILSLCEILCPLVNKVSVTVNNEEQLAVLELFQHLQNVLIMGKVDVNNFLICRGENLVDLTFIESTLSIPVLMKSCSNLKSLFLDHVSFESTEEENKNLIPLPKLENLHLGLKYEYPITEASLKSLNLLFSSRSLSKLYTRHLDGDEIQSIFLKSCSNQNLKEIKIEDSKHITKTFVQSILATCSSDAFLDLDTCVPITSDELSSIRHINNAVKINFSFKDNHIAEYDLYEEVFNLGLSDSDDDFYNGYDYYDNLDDYDEGEYDDYY